LRLKAHVLFVSGNKKCEMGLIIIIILVITIIIIIIIIIIHTHTLPAFCPPHPTQDTLHVVD